MDSAWYALYTRPRHEKRVCEELAALAIETFLPLYKVRKRWSDRYRLVEEPLFRNYLFVKTATDEIRSVLRPYGAVSLVSFDGAPAQVPEDEIDAVRRLVDSELPFNPHPYLRVGRRVRVNSGPLEGCEGILMRKKGLARLVLSIHLLQQSVSAEVEAGCVEPLTSR